MWIGASGSSPHTASFVAPRFDWVPGLVDDLVAFSRRTDVEPFLQVAVAHAQFETIHPFSDGNGRTGRALVQSMLRSYGITQRITAPVSAGLLSEVEGYYEALTAYRQGDLDPIVVAFSRAAFAAIANGEVLVRDLVALRDAWAGRVSARADASVWRALPQVMSQPAVTVNHLAQRLGISKPAAQTAIDQMVAGEVLTPVNSYRRNRVWVAGEVVAVLDEFAERAGRRRFSAG
ncbi:MAG: Fic family protein [Nocardioides sp.]|nr:Fic family protein [Nocardioides sp.]